MKTGLLALAAAGVLAATPLVAQDHSMALKARQGQFSIMAINLGMLGAMAKGEMPYDAEAAQTAADSLVAVSQISQSPLWPEGSDNFSVDGTRAQPTIWEENDDFVSKWLAFGEAAAAMQAGAAGGQEALGPLLGQVGGTCSACHKAHRAPEN
jgi:cytochrome c556